MTYGPEPRHFKAQLPTPPQDSLQGERAGQYLMSPDENEAAPEAPKSRWRSAWVIVRGRWPR